MSRRRDDGGRDGETTSGRRDGERMRRRGVEMTRGPNGEKDRAELRAGEREKNSGREDQTPGRHTALKVQDDETTRGREDEQSGAGE
jgi:hypothetical protein